ncbi:hypothetical protein [Kitasatospora sp. NPDC050463]|uniref:hypothetical protein n=1 Tax=Kitasatospora sp. NPDC050463 TaxID=3155786 RepID=UPI0033DA6C64
MLALVLDLCQYLWKTSVWAVWARAREKALQGGDPLKVVDDLEVGGAPDWFNRPTWTIFTLKMVALVAAYVVIAIDLADRIKLS